MSMISWRNGKEGGRLAGTKKGAFSGGRGDMRCQANLYSQAPSGLRAGWWFYDPENATSNRAAWAAHLGLARSAIRSPAWEWSGKLHADQQNSLERSIGHARAETTEAISRIAGKSVRPRHRNGQQR